MAQPTIWNTSVLNSNLSSSSDSSHFVSIRVHSWLLFVGGNLWQRRREQAFLFFLIQRHTCGRDDARGDEDDQVLFSVLLDIGAKRSADERNVANDGNFILGFLHVFTHQSTDYDRLPVINADTRSNLARAEDRLVNHIGGKLDGLGNA